MKGKQIDFENDEQNIRIVFWEDGTADVSSSCAWGGFIDMKLEKEDVTELKELLEEEF